MRRTMVFSALAASAAALGQSPLWTQVEGTPSVRVRDGASGYSLRGDLGASQARVSDLRTQLQTAHSGRGASVLDATVDGSRTVLSRIEDNGDGTQSTYADVFTSGGSLLRSVYLFNDQPGSYAPEKVGFTQDGRHLFVQYWADAEGNYAPSVAVVRLLDGRAFAAQGRMLTLPDMGKALLTTPEGVLELLDLDSGSHSGFPTATPAGFQPRDARGDWILGLNGSAWLAIRRSDGLQRPIIPSGGEVVLGIAWAGKVVVLANPSTGALRSVALSNGVVRMLLSGPAGAVSLSPDRSRIVQALDGGRRGLLRVSDSDLAVSDERQWLAGLDTNGRAWFLHDTEMRKRDDGGSVVESRAMTPGPGKLIWSDGTYAVERLDYVPNEIYYKVDLATGVRTRWFQFAPSVGSTVDFWKDQRAIRHYRQNGFDMISVYAGVDAQTYAYFPHGQDHLAVQKFLASGLLYGTYTEGPPSVAGNCYFAIYDPFTGRKVKRISLGTTRDIAPAAVNTTGTWALVPTILDGRLVDLVNGKARRLNGQAAKDWQASVDAAAGQPMAAISGNGAVIFLSSGEIGGFYRASDGRKLASAPRDSTAVLSNDGLRALVTTQGSRALYAIPATP